jgi:hypothetical protein
MKRKRPVKPPPEGAPLAKEVRLGFSPEARAVFDKLPSKLQDGLRRKLREFGVSPAIGKPLVGELFGYHRITYGRVRSISMRVIASVAKSDVVAVMTLYIGLRKAGSADDPYEIAAAAVRRRDPDAVHAIELMLQQEAPPKVSTDDS